MSTAPPPDRLSAVLLGACMFTTGASGLVNEYVLATTTTYLLGNGIEQFSVVIALMMLMMGVAGFVQRSVADRTLFSRFIAVEVLMALLGGFAPTLLLAAHAHLNDHFRLALYGLVGIIGFLIGFEIPLVMRLVGELGISLKENLSLIYALDYVGAFLGAMGWVYFLLPRLPLGEISLWVAAINFAVAVLTVLLRRGLGGWSSIPLLLLTCALLGVGFLHTREWSATLEQKFYDDPIVFAATTRYQHLVVTHNARLGDTRLYINGNTQFSSLDEMVYHELLAHPAMALTPDHGRVLILGGGDGLLLREVLKYPDVREVVLVDLDPDMVRLAREEPALRRINQDSFRDARVTAGGSAAVGEEGQRPVYMATPGLNTQGRPRTEQVATVSVLHLDAARFAAEIPGFFNVILIDLPDPNSVELAKLYSLEFYALLHKRLAATGLMALQATSPYHAKEAFLTIGRTLQGANFSILPYHDNVPSFGDWGWYLAFRPRPLEEEIARLAAFPVPTRYLTPDLFRASLRFGKGRLHTEDSGINTIMHPLLLHHYLKSGWQVP